MNRPQRNMKRRFNDEDGYDNEGPNNGAVMSLRRPNKKRSKHTISSTDSGHKATTPPEPPSSPPRKPKMSFTNLNLDVRLMIYELAAVPSKHTEPFFTFSPTEWSMWLIASQLGDLEALQAMKSYLQTDILNPASDAAKDRTLVNQFLTFAARARCLGSEFTWNLANGGHLKALQWARQQGCLIEKDKCMETAVSRGHLQVVRWLRNELHCEWNQYYCAVAAKAGHLTVLHWLRRHDCPWSENIYSAAASNGHLHVLDWLHQQQPSYPVPVDETLCSTAAEHDQTAVLQWMKDHGLPLEYVFKYAVRADRRWTILWLLGHGYTWDIDTFVVAVEKGSIDLLRWLKRLGCPWDQDTFWSASLAGRLDIMKWLRSNGCPWDARVFAAAARGKHSMALKWLHRVKCPCDERTMQAAAQSADLTTLMWVHRMKYPWDVRTGIAAAETCSMYTLMWLRDVGCPWDSARCKEAAKRNPNLQAREWVHMNGYTYFEE